MTASPMNFSTVPPCRSRTALTSIEVARDHAPQRLGVELLAERRRVDDVAEEDRDRLAHLAPRSVSGLPQARQNLAWAGLASPQVGQAAMSSLRERRPKTRVRTLSRSCSTPSQTSSRAPSASSAAAASSTRKPISRAMREIRLALLEADVNFKVVKEFVARVRERALGQEVTEEPHARPAGREDRPRGADRR